MTVPCWNIVGRWDNFDGPKVWCPYIYFVYAAINFNSVTFLCIFRCYYIGSVLGEPASKAAVSLCDGGMRGMVYWGSGNKTLAIYPLPHDVNSTATVSDAHVIVSINQTTKLLTEFDGMNSENVFRNSARRLFPFSLKKQDRVLVF